MNNEIFPILFVGYNLKFSLFISLYIYLRCNTYIFLRNYSHLCSDLRIIIYSRKFIPSLIDLYISRSLKFIVGNNNNNNNINDEHPYIYHFLQKNGAEIKRKEGTKGWFPVDQLKEGVGLLVSTFTEWRKMRWHLTFVPTSSNLILHLSFSGDGWKTELEEWDKNEKASSGRPIWTSQMEIIMHVTGALDFSFPLTQTFVLNSVVQLCHGLHRQC